MSAEERRAINITPENRALAAEIAGGEAEALALVEWARSALPKERIDQINGMRHTRQPNEKTGELEEVLDYNRWPHQVQVLRSEYEDRAPRGENPFKSKQEMDKVYDVLRDRGEDPFKDEAYMARLNATPPAVRRGAMSLPLTSP